MPSPLPYGKFYYKDWLASSSVSEMTYEAQGVYFRLLCYLWEDGILPLDTDRWARRLGLESGGLIWVSVFPQIIGCFVKLEHGYTNIRMAKDREDAMKYLQKQVVNGAKGGRPTGSKSEKPSRQKPKPIPPLSKTETQNNPSLTYPQPHTYKSPIVPAGFDEFWNSYPKREGPNPKQPAIQSYRKALKSGVTPDDILNGCIAYAHDPSTQIGTKFVPQAVTWLNQSRWADSCSKNSHTEINDNLKAFLASTNP